METSQNVYHVTVDALDEHFLESLREKYPHASLEIKVAPPLTRGLAEDKFWEIIEKLDWSKEGDNNAVIEPAVEALSKLSLRNIYEFQDLLSEKLYRLDMRQYAENVGENSYREEDEDANFSADEFLYARCCVVANGRQKYEEALKNPAAMPKDLTFESLLRVARSAYERKTGQRFRYVPAYNFETFGNREGWKK